jgi:hypothetical protein
MTRWVVVVEQGGAGRNEHRVEATTAEGAIERVEDWMEMNAHPLWYSTATFTAYNDDEHTEQTLTADALARAFPDWTEIDMLSRRLMVDDCMSAVHEDGISVPEYAARIGRSNLRSYTDQLVAAHRGR